MRALPISYPITYTHEQHYTDSVGYKFECECAVCILNVYVCMWLYYFYIQNVKHYYGHIVVYIVEAERKEWKCDKYHLHVTNSQKTKINV